MQYAADDSVFHLSPSASNDGDIGVDLIEKEDGWIAVATSSSAETSIFDCERAKR